MKSKIFIDTFAIQKLEFRYSPGQPHQTRIMRVETRLVSSNGVKGYYYLHGDRINDTMIIVKNVTVHYNSHSFSHQTYASNYTNNLIFI
jgi:hypothetical protein